MKRLKDFVERKFRYDVDIALFIACCTLVCLFIYGILTTIFPNSDIGGKSPLEGEYEVVQYLHDDNIFSNQEELIQGLEYLRKKTNIQVIIIASSDKWSDGAAVREYYLTVGTYSARGSTRRIYKSISIRYWQQSKSSNR